MSSAATIVAYDAAYDAAFRALNLAWLEAYVEVEETDRRQLADPRGTIIAPGGAIFFAIEAGQAVGTCALLKRPADTYELAKMAVAPEAQGRGLGSRLLEAAIGWAVQQRAQRIVLVSNTALEPALRLYRKYGFETTHRGPHPAYKTADIAMQLDLHDHA